MTTSFKSIRRGTGLTPHIDKGTAGCCKFTYSNSDFTLAPPDPQVAVGGGKVMEMANSIWAVWTKSGKRLGGGSLNDFFHVSADLGTFDPQILFDVLSSRWIASIQTVNQDPEQNQILIAYSKTSDPMGNWGVATVDQQDGVTMDQPMLGVSSGMVALSWNDYKQSCALGCTGANFTGSQMWVANKAQLLAGQKFDMYKTDPDPMTSRVVPVRSLSPTDTQYFVYRGANGRTVSVASWTGLPGLGDGVNTDETALDIQRLESPPSAIQPGDKSPTLAVNSTALISAVWQNDVLWAAANDGCMSDQDATARSCLRLLQISTSGDSPTLEQDFDVSQDGTYLYYPAVTMDSAGDMYVAFTVSSNTRYPTAAVAAQPAGSDGGSISTWTPLAKGTGCYYCPQKDPKSGPERWGDYSGAAVDGDDPTHVWVMAEYGALADSSNDWGTVTANFSYTRKSSAFHK